MKIKFNKIHIQNFLSFSDSELELSNLGFVLVNGVNNNTVDCSKSNGSGKSAIWDAISWALCGETIRGIKSVTNIYGDDGALVELEFYIDNDKYKIIRTKDNSKYHSDLKIFINDIDKSGKGLRESEKLLKEYLPDLTSYLIGSVIILGQGLPQRLSNNTPSGRKEILEKLSKSDFMIDDLKERISDRKSSLNNRLRKIQDKLIQLKADERSTQLAITNDKEEIETSENIEQLNNDIEVIKAKIVDYTNSLNEKELAMNECDKSICELQNQLNNTKNKYQNEFDNIKNTFAKSKEKAHTELVELKTKRDFVRNKIVELESISDICPTCGQKIEGVEHPNCDEQKIKLGELNQKVNDAQSLLDDLIVQENDAINVLNHSYENIGHLQCELDSKIDWQKQYKPIIEELNIEINKHQIDLARFETKRDSYKEHIISLQKNINDNTIKLLKIQDEILYNTNEEENMKLHLDTISQMNTIITRDFRGFLLQNVISYINQKCKEYSLEVFDSDKIEFTLDGNNISISYCGKEYESLSGGEKQKIDVIMQLSIRDMLCNYLNFTSNILVLDEVFDGMDLLSCQKIIQLITNKLTDIESIYIITHRQELNIPYDKIITIVKDNNGISNIQ